MPVESQLLPEDGMVNPERAVYILSMSCVSGDDVQIAIHDREDIVPWLKKIDHEGSSWTATQHTFRGGVVVQTDDITLEIEAEYGR